MPLTATQPKPPTKAIKETVTKACVDYITEDLHPYDSIPGEGFLDMVDAVSASTFTNYNPHLRLLLWGQV